jgi:hypothetical protein
MVCIVNVVLSFQLVRLQKIHYTDNLWKEMNENNLFQITYVQLFVWPLLTNFMAQDFTWERNNHSTSKRITCFQGSWNLTPVLTKARRWTIFCKFNPVQFISFQFSRRNLFCYHCCLLSDAVSIGTMEDIFIQSGERNAPLFYLWITSLFELQYWKPHTKRKIIVWRFILCEPSV